MSTYRIADDQWQKLYAYLQGHPLANAGQEEKCRRFINRIKPTKGAPTGGGHPQGVPLRMDNDVIYNPDIHHRKSIRLDGYDYSRAGAYFISIAAQGRL